jgi:hypothetical protein
VKDSSILRPRDFLGYMQATAYIYLGISVGLTVQKKGKIQTQVTVENFYTKIEVAPVPNQSINAWEKRLNRVILIYRDDIRN